MIDMLVGKDMKSKYKQTIGGEKHPQLSDNNSKGSGELKEDVLQKLLEEMREMKKSIANLKQDKLPKSISG